MRCTRFWIVAKNKAKVNVKELAAVRHADVLKVAVADAEDIGDDAAGRNTTIEIIEELIQ